MAAVAFICVEFAQATERQRKVERVVTVQREGLLSRIGERLDNRRVERVVRVEVNDHHDQRVERVVRVERQHVHHAPERIVERVFVRDYHEPRLEVQREHVECVEELNADYGDTRREIRIERSVQGHDCGAFFRAK